MHVSVCQAAACVNCPFTYIDAFFAQKFRFFCKNQEKFLQAILVRKFGTKTAKIIDIFQNMSIIIMGV
jgi:hypothetical protein